VEIEGRMNYPAQLPHISQLDTHAQT
jgi:hypothetical protein